MHLVGALLYEDFVSLHGVGSYLSGVELYVGHQEGENARRIRKEIEIEIEKANKSLCGV